MHSIQSRADSSGTLPRYSAAFAEGVAKCTLSKAALTTGAPGPRHPADEREGYHEKMD